MREKPIEDFFSRHGKLREDELMVHDLMLVQVKKPEESKYPWDYYKILSHISGERGVRPAGSGLFAGEEVAAGHPAGLGRGRWFTPILRPQGHGTSSRRRACYGRPA